MSLRKKLFIALSIVLLLVAFQGITTVLLLTQVVEDTALLVSPALSRIDNLAHSDADLLRLRSVEHAFLLSTNNMERQWYLPEMHALRDEIQQRLQDYGAADMDQERAQTFSLISILWPQYLASNERVVQTAQAGDQEGATAEHLGFAHDFNTLESQLHALRHQEYDAAEALREQLIQAATWLRWPLGGIVLLVALADVGVVWYFSGSISLSLDLLQAGARRIAAEHFSEPVPAPPEAELAALAGTLNAVMETLAASKEEKARLEGERLQLLRDRLNQIVRAQEEERGRVSRELHDQAGQALMALQYGLSRVQRLSSDPKIAAELERLLTVAAETGQQIRSLARDLRPAVLDDLGLVPTLRSYVREFSERIGLPIEFSSLGPLTRMPSEAETAVFRVVQEALTNIGKHAHARHAWVVVTFKDERLQVTVQDDGIGFNTTDAEDKSRRPGLGLAGIQERVHLLGGDFSITSRDGAGTELLVTLPISRATEVVTTNVV